MAGYVAIAVAGLVALGIVVLLVLRGESRRVGREAADRKHITDAARRREEADLAQAQNPTADEAAWLRRQRALRRRWLRERRRRR